MALWAILWIILSVALAHGDEHIRIYELPTVLALCDDIKIECESSGLNQTPTQERYYTSFCMRSDSMTEHMLVPERCKLIFPASPRARSFPTPKSATQATTQQTEGEAEGQYAEIINRLEQKIENAQEYFRDNLRSIDVEVKQFKSQQERERLEKNKQP